MTKYILILVISALFAYGCSPKAQLRRAERLIKKAELSGAKWTSDTVFVNVPVYIKEVSKDTLFLSKPGDTVTISKDRLKVIYIDLPGDSVFISGECLPDTVIKKVPVTVTNVIHAPKPKVSWWQWLLIGMFIGVVLILIIKK